MIEKKRDQELYDKVSQRLREKMNENNIKAIELAEKTGLSRSSISQYVNGVHVPNTTAAYKIAEVLHCNPVYLMGFDVNPNANPEAVEYYVETPEGSVKLSSHDYTIEDLRGMSYLLEMECKDKDRANHILAYMSELYKAYEKAPKHIQDAVRTLLNGDGNDESK